LRLLRRGHARKSLDIVQRLLQIQISEGDLFCKNWDTVAKANVIKRINILLTSYLIATHLDRRLD
jgi:hypothetical protein